MGSARVTREEARLLNDAADRSLRDPSDEHLREFTRLCAPLDASAMAERVRRRAALLTRGDPANRQQILAARDALVLASYRSATPEDWFCAWCDASVVRLEGRPAAGVGGIITDPDGRVVAHFCRRAGELSAFEAEIMALSATLRAALDQAAQRIRVHTDCDALVVLWLKHRDDPRLASVRVLAREFRRIEVRWVPRRHNQRADHLARNATHGYAVQGDE